MSKSLVSDLSPNELACYIIIRSIQTADDSVLFVSNGMIEAYLTGVPNALSRDQRKSIADGLKSLCKTLKLAPIQFSQSEWLINCDSLKIDTAKANRKNGGEFFTIIHREDIQKIFAIKTKANKFKLLKYFVVLIGSINNTKAEDKGKHKRSGEGVSGFMPNEWLATQSQISTKTALDYNELLEGAKVVFFYRSKCYPCNEAHQFKSFPNYYGLFKDAERITTIAKAAEADTDKRWFKKGDANERRSMTQKLNKLNQGYSGYSLEEVKKLREYEANLKADASNKNSSAAQNTEQAVVKSDINGMLDFFSSGGEESPKAAEEITSLAEQRVAQAPEQETAPTVSYSTPTARKRRCFDEILNDSSDKGSTEHQQIDGFSAADDGDDDINAVFDRLEKQKQDASKINDVSESARENLQSAALPDMFGEETKEDQNPNDSPKRRAWDGYYDRFEPRNKVNSDDASMQRETKSPEERCTEPISAQAKELVSDFFKK